MLTDLKTESTSAVTDGKNITSIAREISKKDGAKPLGLRIEPIIDPSAVHPSHPVCVENKECDDKIEDENKERKEDS